MTFDCSDVTHTSRHGFTALADLANVLQRHATTLRFTNPSPAVARMLNITRFNIIGDLE